MPQHDRAALWNAISGGGSLSARFLAGAHQTFSLSELVHGSCLQGRAGELRGRSVLIAVSDHFAAALALIEIDGIASRLVLCPGDLSEDHLGFVAASARVDAIVSDHAPAGSGAHGIGLRLQLTPTITHAEYDRSRPQPTEWILLTSGTTGLPKLAVHTLSSLAGAIAEGPPTAIPVWSTFYDIRRYGGLQIFLRAVLAGGSLVLPGAGESITDFLARAGALGVTHISGTPSHWRRALMSPSAHRITPQCVRLSGEIADQSILNQLHAFYPQARVVHAFASTEAGLAFEVSDGRAGFPVSLIENRSSDVAMKVEAGSLRVRSARIAARYFGPAAEALAGPDGFVDTGDMVERHGDRYYFVGRRDGVINVGGLKVHPEEVEAVIHRHPAVRMAVVRMRKSPITGALVVADVVLKIPGNGRTSELEQEILELCRADLPRHKVPAAIRFVSDLTVAGTGKMVRQPCATSS